MRYYNLRLIQVILRGSHEIVRKKKITFENILGQKCLKPSNCCCKSCKLALVGPKKLMFHV